MTDNSNVYFPPSANSGSSPVAPPTNTFALVGFILSLLSLATFITAIPGLVLGHLGLKQIRETGQDGHGMAVAAVTIGWVVVGLGVLTALIFAFILLVPLIIIGSAAVNGGY